MIFEIFLMISAEISHFLTEIIKKNFLNKGILFLYSKNGFLLCVTSKFFTRKNKTFIILVFFSVRDNKYFCIFAPSKSKNIKRHYGRQDGIIRTR